MTDAPAARPFRVLLVEDSPSDRLITTAALELAGIGDAVNIVSNGREALDFLRREGEHREALRPDLILLDLNLPRMDGREVLAQLKADRQLRHIPVLVLSTSADDEDVVYAYREHANSYLTKPVDLEHFTRMLATVRDYWRDTVRLPSAEMLRRQAEQRLTPTAAVSPDTVRVLLVEDSPVDAMLVREALHGSRAFRFDVTYVTRLEAALERLGHEPADVVLTDLGLPDSQGAETVRRLTAAARGRPVIVLTGDEREEAGIEALRAGADDVLVKGQLSAAAVARSVRLALDRAEAQDRLRQAQWLEAVGHLAGGVAHEFNNLLTVVRGNAALLAGETDPQAVTELASEIQQAAARGAGLTRQLLTFSRREEMSAGRIALPTALGELAPVFEGALGPSVTLQLSLDPATPDVEGDVELLEQAILQLLVNARDAMPTGGIVELACEPRTLSAADAPRTGPDAYPGRFARVSVVDHGIGMSADVLENIWNPFYTTKEQGRGSGLGLPVVHGIAQRHRGWVRAESTPGEGTRIEVWLPAAAAIP